MKLFTRVLLTGICVSLLTISAMGKRPEAPSEVCTITGDIVSDGEITLGTQVDLWLSANILPPFDEVGPYVALDLLGYYVDGGDPPWPSISEAPLWIEWIEGEFEPSEYLLPLLNTDLGLGRYYSGVAQLSEGIYDGRLDFEFSPHGPCTPRPWGTTLPVDDDPAIWAEWRLSDDEDSPPVCPFALVLLGGHEDPDTGNVTFEATSELFLVRKGGYPRVLLYDFTLGPLCPDAQKPGKGNEKLPPPEPIPPCIKDADGYTVGTGPVENPIVLFDFSQQN